MLVIAAQTFREMFKKKVFILVLLLTLAFLLLYGTGLYFANKNGNVDAIYRNIMLTQLFSAGLYFASFINAFLVVAAAAGTISGEIENGTLYAIVPKPLQRSEIVLGKFLGLGTMLVVYSAGFFGAVLLLNQVMSKWSLAFLTPPGLVKGLLLFSLQPIILLSLGMWGTAFLPTIGNGILVVMLYGLGMIGGIMEQLGTIMKNATLVNIGIISSLIMPTDAIYRKMVSTLFSSGTINFLTAGPFGGVTEPSVWMVVYTIGYIMLFITLAVRKFNRRDI